MPATKVHAATVDKEAGASAPNGALTLDAILASDDLPTEIVDVPEWAGHVEVKAISGRQRDSIVTQFMDRAGDMDFTKFPDFRLMLVAYSMVDANGQRLANADNVREVMDQLGEKSSAALERIWTAALRLAGMGAGQPDKILEDLKADPSGTTG